MPVRIDPLTGELRSDADVVGAVTSVFGRTGAVVAATNDYTWAQIDKTISDLADLTTKSHASLSSIGTNTHAQIDTHIADTTIHFVDTAYLKVDGTRPLTGAWDAGSFQIRAETFQSDVVTGTAPLTIASTTLVTNLNADLLDGSHATAFAAATHVHAASDITSGTLAVARGGTNLASGTSGGILGYTAAGVLASSVLLTANALVLGGGAGATPAPLGSLGTTTTVLHGNAAGAPTFAAVSLTADVSGTLPYNNGGTGQSTWAQGDLLYASAANTLAKLTIGGANTVLVSNGTIPGWSATLAGLTLTTPTIGDFTNAGHDHEDAAGGGTLDHNAALTNLTTGDVHTQYALLAGRSGGQTLYGSTDAAESLTLIPNSTDGAGYLELDGEVNLRGSLAALAALTAYNCITFDSSITLSGSGITLQTFNFVPTVVINQASFTYAGARFGGTFTTSVAASAVQGVVVSPTMKTGTTSIGNIVPPKAFYDPTTLELNHSGCSYVSDAFMSLLSSPTFKATAGTNFVTWAHRCIVDQPTYNDSVGGGNTFTRRGYVFKTPIDAAGTNYQWGSAALYVEDQTLTNYINPVAAVHSLINANSALHFNLYFSGTATSASAGAFALGTTSQPTTGCGALDLAKDFAIQSVTPAQITGDQNDYAGHSTYSVARLNTDATRTITGLANGYAGRMLFIINVGTHFLCFANQSASSSAANRIITGTGATIYLDADDSVILRYDGTDSRWRVLK